jgi:hypothetical protein
MVVTSLMHNWNFYTNSLELQKITSKCKKSNLKKVNSKYCVGWKVDIDECLADFKYHKDNSPNLFVNNIIYLFQLK